MGILDLDNKPDDFIKIMEEYAKNPRGFLLLAGKNGTGKSYAAQCILNYSKRNHFDENTLPYGHDPIFINQSDLHSKLMQTQAKYGYIEELKNYYYNSVFLVLDDLGTRTPSDFLVDFIYAVVDKRYNLRHNLPTIITTNLNSSQMREKLTDPIVSRIASGKVYRCDWEDRRFQEF